MDSDLDNYEGVIGLEIHAQLLTKSKIFCGCSAEYGALPNTNVCPLCMGHPGVLPVLNEKTIEFILLMGLAVNCKINSFTQFARKNYFYPDLPKGYQISQFELPFCENGFLDIEPEKGKPRRIRIRRIHLEEDAGKLIHDGSHSIIDLNRSGVPLIEIVSEPDLNSSEEASLFLSRIRQVVQYLKICDGNMEEGSFRCDANVSVRLKGSKELGTKTELKNMNSFRNIERAIDFEINRQTDLLRNNGTVTQQTLLWDADKQEAVVQRSKEESHDYRYFPEPDLFPIKIPDQKQEEIRKNLPELPWQKKEKFTSKYNLPEYDASVLTAERDLAEYFEKVVEYCSDYKMVSNWIMTEVLQHKGAEGFPVPAENLAELLISVTSGEINLKIAKEVFSIMIAENMKAAEIIDARGLKQITNSDEVARIAEEVLAQNKKEIDEYLSGKEKVLGFLVGKIMKQTGGKANPAIVNKILKEKLQSLKN
jgi:aspartyl-tRNA(Asn)/glutamyl-tRNA(Gln) amidotransferase subunit B